ncbi:MAG: hemolysin III family protein [Xanthomonadaceae bacterium]|nr:hemolysin III family protein [Xanthomonadaceae bacterium]
MRICDHQEEIANALTHGLGLLASIVGGAVLITLTALFGDTRLLIGTTVFVGSLLLLYSTSTLYHAIRDQLAKTWLQVFDHCAVFILIAGTYTPFALGALEGAWGWGLLVAVWSIALAGIVFKCFCAGRLHLLSTMIYLGMGWLALAAIEPILEALSTSALIWLVTGGIAYTAGTLFYHSHRRYAHAIWHVFVLAGSSCHFAAVLSLVLPPSGA